MDQTHFSQSRRATGLRYAPIIGKYGLFQGSATGANGNGSGPNGAVGHGKCQDSVKVIDAYAATRRTGTGK